MTPPMTPREKVEDRGPVGAIMDALWPILGGNHMPAETWEEINSAILTALASGSGDHAELARLADDLRKFEHHAVGSLKIGMDEVRRIIAACDVHAALLAENAALRAERDREANDARLIASACDKMRVLHRDEIRDVLRRATKAERKLAEAEEVGLSIYIYANDTLSGRIDGPDDRTWQRAAVVEIRNRARVFRSKEAERG